MLGIKNTFSNTVIAFSKLLKMKYTEAKLEDTVIEILQNQGFEYVKGEAIQRSPEEVLIKADLKSFLAARYAADEITDSEI